MKKVIFTILFFCNLSAEIQFTQARGLYTVFKDKKYLSPLHGFCWWKSGQIEEMYRYGNREDALIQLIREIFYLNDWDWLTFGPTVLPNKIAYYFTPRIIGIILQTIDTFTFQAISDEALHAAKNALISTLKSELNYDQLIAQGKAQQLELRKKSLEEITAFQQQIAQMKEVAKNQEVQKNDAIEQEKKLRQLVTNLSSQIKQYTKQKKDTAQLGQNLSMKKFELQMAQDAVQKISNGLKNIKNQIIHNENSIRRIESGIKHAGLEDKALEQFIDMLFLAIKETWPGTNQKYVPLAVHNVLLGFLWKKIAEKKEFIEYFRVLPSAVFNDVSFMDSTSEAYTQWIEEEYENTIYQQVFKNLDPATMDIDGQLEELIIALYAYAVFTSSFPPQVLSGWTTYQGFQFPDCVSTSIRNALNNFMYNPSRGILEVDLLLRLNPHPKLRKFLQKFNQVEQIQDEQTRKAWVNVVSDLNMSEDDPQYIIDYKTPPGSAICEIAARGGIQNIQNVLKKLFAVASVEELLQKLPRKISMAFSPNADPNFGVMTFTINGNQRFSWHIEPKHAYVETIPHYIKTDPRVAPFMEKVISLFEPNSATSHEILNNNLFDLCMLFRDRQEFVIKAVPLFEAKGFDKVYLSHLVMVLLDTYLTYNKYAFIRTVMSHDFGTSQTIIGNTMLRIIKDIVEEGKHNYPQIVATIIPTPQFANQQFAYRKQVDRIVFDGIEYIKEKDPSALSPIIDLILKNSIAQLYGTIKKQPFTLEQLRLISLNKIEPLYEKITQQLNQLKKQATSLTPDQEHFIIVVYQQNIEKFTCFIKDAFPAIVAK